MELGQRAAEFAESTNTLRPAGDPGHSTLLDRSVYAAVLDLCAAAEVTRKNVWALFRQADQATKAAKEPGSGTGSLARNSMRATKRALAVVDDERAFLQALEVMRQRAGLSTRALRAELSRRFVRVPAQSTLDNWFKADRIPAQMNEYLLSMIVTILSEHIAGVDTHDIDFDQVEAFVDRYRRLLECRVTDDSEDRLAKRMLRHVAIRTREATSLPEADQGTESRVIEARLEELAALEKLIVTEIAGTQTSQPDRRTAVA